MQRVPADSSTSERPLYEETRQIDGIETGDSTCPSQGASLGPFMRLWTKGVTNTTRGILGLSQTRFWGISYQNNNTRKKEQSNKTSTQSRHYQRPHGWYPFKNTMNTIPMPGCPTYSGPRHEAVPDAGDTQPTVSHLYTIPEHHFDTSFQDPDHDINQDF